MPYLFENTLIIIIIIIINNNKSFIYTGDIYQHYKMLFFTRFPVNKIYKNVVLN